MERGYPRRYPAVLGPVAQGLERAAHNRLAAGSNPAGPTKREKRMQSNAKTVEEYLASLPEDRREALTIVRQTILKNLDKGFQETMQYGMVGYSVPHSIFPPGYHCDPKQPLPFAGFASQKNFMAIYLYCIYSDTDAEKNFKAEYASTGKKMDMGKCCVRFKKLEDLPLELIGKTIKAITVKKCVDHYQTVLAEMQLNRKKK